MRKLMKSKWTALCLVLVLVGILAGCGNEELTAESLKDAKVEKYVTVSDSYKGMPVTVQASTTVTDADVEYYIQRTAQNVEEMHITDTSVAVKQGDVVNIDYAGSVDGEYFEGGTAQNQFLEIGSGSFIAGFEDGLVGVKVGDSVELNLTFPEQYKEDLAGKDCVFEVKVNYILKELTDETVGYLDSEYTSADQYRTDVKKVLQSYMDSQYDYSVKSQLASGLLNACSFKEIPESLVADFETDLREDLTLSAQSSGLSLEDYIMSRYNVTAEEVDSTIRTLAEGCAKEGLALQYVANKEKLKVNDEELEAELQEALKLGEYATMEELLSAVGGREKVRWNLMYDKVYGFLEENAQISAN